MRVESVSSWDQSFFENFLMFRNKIHLCLETSFPETIEDYVRYFFPSSAFATDFSWEAFLVKKDDIVIAKAILCFRSDSKLGNLGFIDWEDDVLGAQLLIDSVINSAKKNGLKKIKTPVDLNFFIKYRIRLPSTNQPFWGEPIYPDYYHELFQKTGFSELARWDTYKINKTQAIIDYLTKRKKLSGEYTQRKEKSAKTFNKVSVRKINIGNWDNELRIIYELFLTAYKSMPEWEPLSFEQFKIIYDDFKYIINPWYSFIAIYEGKPVGFSINFVDPLSILQKIKGKKLSPLNKLWLLLKLRMNLSCLLIAHVGKIPGPDGLGIKGVQIKFSERIQYFMPLMRKVLVTFQISDSPSRRSFNESYLEPYAQYVLYHKDL